MSTSVRSPVAEVRDPSVATSGRFVDFPGSPFQLFQPYAPAGDQSPAIAQLVDGVADGLSYQTLLGVTGSGKTFTMANVIAQLGRPAIVFAPNKTLAAQLYSEFREFFPKNAVEYFVSYYDYYQPEAYVPQRDLYIEKDSSINDHIEQMRLSATKSLLERRDVVIVATVSAIYGIGNPSDYHKMVMTIRARRQDGPARRDRAADPHAVHAQRDRLQPRHVSRARRHDRRLPGRAQRTRAAHRVVRRRGGVAVAARPAERPRAPEDPALHRLSVEPLRDAARPRGGGHRDHQGRVARPARRVRQGRQAGRGAAPGAAHPVRPRDAAGGGPLQGHRELHPPPVGCGARRAAAHAGGLPAARRDHVSRREPRADRPAWRHVPRRPLAQGDAGRVRVQAAQRAGQPAAEVRRVRTQDAPGRVRVGHAGRLRAPARRAGGGATGAPHRVDRSGGRGSIGRHAGRRRAAGDPRARAGPRAGADHHA